LPVTVIPCCADFEHFRLATAVERAKARAELGLAEDAPLLVHVGSLGCNCLLEEMLDFFTVYRERHNAAQFLFIAPSGEPVVHEAAAGRGLAHAVHVRSASRNEVPYWLGAADLGIMFVRPVRSKAAASPTKLGEMLAVGLPIVANSCVGDVAEILRDTSTGIAIDRFDEAAYREAIGEVESLRATPQEVRNEGLRWFDLRRGIDLYDEIYRRLSARSRP
jgi:glycosyltransferase involved in cell wall biosynthesis